MPATLPKPQTPPGLRPGGQLLPLGPAVIPPGGTARLSTQPAVAPATATCTARPDDCTTHGHSFTLLNDLLRAIPGAATTILWFDERLSEVHHHDPTRPTADLVNLAGPTSAACTCLCPRPRRRDEDGVAVRVAALPRKSTAKQASSIDREVEDSRRFIGQRSWPLVESAIFFVPEGVTGAGVDRPEFRALLAAGEKRLVDAVVLQTNDRLTRLMLETVTMLVALRDVGVRVYSYTTGEARKVDSPMDRLMLAIKGAVAEIESESIITRSTRAAFYRARLGFVAGNRLYGYDDAPFDLGGKTFKTPIPNAEEVKWVTWLHEMYEQGWGHRRIADGLNCLGARSPRARGKDLQTSHHTAVREVLMNESYVGVLVFGETPRVIRGGVKKEPIRTPDRVERMQLPHLRIRDEALRPRNRDRFAADKTGERKVGRTPTTALVGNVRCTCGSRMGIAGSNKVYSYLLCHQARDKARENRTSRPAEALTQRFVTELLRVIDQPGLVDEALALHAARESTPPAESDEWEAPTRHVGELTREIGNPEIAIGRAASDGVITRLIVLIEAKQGAFTTAEARIMGLESRVTRTLDPDALRARAAEEVVRLADVLRGDIPARRDALRQVLAAPAEAVPTLVNRKKRFLIRLRLRGDSAFSGANRNSEGDPKACVLGKVMSPQRRKPGRSFHPRPASALWVPVPAPCSHAHRRDRSVNATADLLVPPGLKRGRSSAAKSEHIVSYEVAEVAACQTNAAHPSATYAPIRKKRHVTPRSRLRVDIPGDLAQDKVQIHATSGCSPRLSEFDQTLSVRAAEKRMHLLRRIVNPVPGRHGGLCPCPSGPMFQAAVARGATTSVPLPGDPPAADSPVADATVQRDAEAA